MYRKANFLLKETSKIQMLFFFTDRRKRSTQKDPREKQAQAITQKQKETADFEEKKKQSSSMLINHSDPN